jgi:hypothetical protein
VKPIKIVKVQGGYHVLVNDVPCVRGDSGTGATIDRIRAGLPTGGFKGGYKPLYHVAVYDPGHAANFTFARTLDYVYSKDDAFKALRKAKYSETF